MKPKFPWWARIKGRVLFFGIAMSIFPLLFLGFASFNAARLHLENNIQIVNRERSLAFSDQIREFVDNMADSLTNVASTNTALLIGNDHEERLSVLNTLLREEPYLDEIRIADSQFQILAEVSRREVIPPGKASGRLNQTFTMQTRYAVSPIAFSSDGRPEFYLTIPVTDTLTRQTIGFLQAKTDLKGMITKLSNWQIGQKGYFFLVDEQGNLIGHTDFSYVLRREDVRQTPSVASFLAGNSPSSKGTEYLNPEGVRVMSIFAPIGTPNWAVVIEQPVSEAYQPIYDFARKLIFIVLAAISAVTLISIYFGLRLTRPIEHLDSEVRQIITTGKLNQIPSRKSQDEVGRLVLSFNQMLAMLAENQQKIEAEKMLLNTVVAGIGAGMALLDKERRILWWNSIFAAWFNPGDLHGLSCAEIMKGEGLDCLFLANDQIITLEVNGQYRHIRQMYYDLVPNHPEDPAYLLLLEDVTQRVELEARMIETDKMAAIGLLASGVAHEINNPLAIVSAHSEDLVDRLNDLQEPRPTAAEVENVLHIVSEQIQRCKTITNRLLHFARKGKPGRDLIDIGQSAEQTTALLHFQAKQKGIALSAHIEPGLLVWGNESEWQQVILNLLNNALDASSPGGHVQVSVNCNETRDSVILEVKDNGHGIPTGLLKKVFDPFFTTKAPGQGTGLGLFVSYGIVQKMKGSMILDSLEGKGTTIQISLPLNDPKNSADKTRIKNTDDSTDD